MSHLLLIAGARNIFLGGDAFGVEVARRLAAEELPAWVRIADFGIRGIHLAYEFLGGSADCEEPRGAQARRRVCVSRSPAE